MDEMTPDQRSEIIAALESGKKIEAIKLYRNATGSDLADAKFFIETLQYALKTGTVPEVSSDAPAPVREQIDAIVQLLQDGKKIEAIKVYRQATGVGLKEAKESVEAIASERGIESGGGCGTAVVLFALILIAAIWWM